MVDTRRRNRNPFDDDNGYGDVPQGGSASAARVGNIQAAMAAIPTSFPEA
jgi:hypothetical protein